MKIKLILLSVLVLLIFCSPSKNSPNIRFPYEFSETQGIDGNIDQQNFAEPSGICFHPARKTLFVVSDDGSPRLAGGDMPCHLQKSVTLKPVEL